LTLVEPAPKGEGHTPPPCDWRVKVTTSPSPERLDRTATMDLHVPADQVVTSGQSKAFSGPWRV